MTSQPLHQPSSVPPRTFTTKTKVWLWVGAAFFIMVVLPSEVAFYGGVLGASGLVYWIHRHQKQRFSDWVQAHHEYRAAWEAAEQKRREELSRVRPEPRIFKTAEEAEEMACNWMRYFGFVDAEVTPPGPDSGIDVVARDAVGQVKAWAKTVGRPVVQQTYGVARAGEKDAAVFTLGGYTEDAVDWADQHEVALFEFNHAGMVEPSNSHGASWMEHGDRRALQT